MELVYLWKNEVQIVQRIGDPIQSTRINALESPQNLIVLACLKDVGTPYEIRENASHDQTREIKSQLQNGYETKDNS